ncbi:MAG: alanine racemase [Deferribacteres bacterium]|nr:alanine racemase [Deferribacteres bacterium]
MEPHKTFAEINLNALSRNLRVAREKTGNNSSILAVVKADAYGHGAVTVSKHLIKEGVSVLGTAFTGEAAALRESGINIPIVVFFDRDNIDAYFRYDLTPVVFDLATAERLSAEARRRNRLIAIHIKIDTGMSRVGFDTTRARRDIPEIARLKNIRLEGLMSHFSDADLQDKEFANHQLKEFISLGDELRRKKITFKYYHMANSAAVISMPAAHLDMVRPGIMLYGYSYPAADGLEPVLSLKSGILMLKKVPMGTPVSYGRTFITERESIIATIPVGYADGYSRKLSNTGEVLINGRRAPVAGRVCMDTIMVDVTHIPDVSYRSEVVLIGRQGNEEITASEIARRTGTITYEVLTSIGQRIKRVYR